MNPLHIQSYFLYNLWEGISKTASATPLSGIFAKIVSCKTPKHYAPMASVVRSCGKVLAIYCENTVNRQAKTK